MKERYTEIQFYTFMKHLFKAFRNSVNVVDIIDGYCNAGNVDNYVIRKQLREILNDTSPLKSYNEEKTYLARGLGISFRQADKDLIISPTTQQRVMKSITEKPEQFKFTGKRSDDETYKEIMKFMYVVNTMKEI